ncbi:MAG: hypothetical protein AB1780_04780 [Pseudomonadota bacterium]|nr:hypothetical protein [Chromatiaceae bacterium]
MNTLTKLTLAATLTLAFALPAHANSLTENLTQAVSTQLTELSANIKQQAKAALEKTAAELFFSSGTEQAQQQLLNTTSQANAATEQTAKQ